MFEFGSCCLNTAPGFDAPLVFLNYLTLGLILSSQAHYSMPRPASMLWHNNHSKMVFFR